MQHLWSCHKGSDRNTLSLFLDLFLLVYLSDEYQADRILFILGSQVIQTDSDSFLDFHRYGYNITPEYHRIDKNV